MENFTPEAYYDDYGAREWERLERAFYSRLEYEETRHFLDRELPESGHLLDVGGGAGRYSVELAQQGYDVTLVDQSSGQVELAAEKADEHGVTDSMTVQTGAFGSWVSRPTPSTRRSVWVGRSRTSSTSRSVGGRRRNSTVLPRRRAGVRLGDGAPRGAPDHLPDGGSR